MRGLVGQLLAPAFALLVALAGGAALGSAALGTVVGIVLAIGAAVFLGARARRKLSRIERIARGDASIDLEAESVVGGPNEIDHARRTVAQQAIHAGVRRARDTAMLAQQAQVLDRMPDGVMRVAADGRVAYANVAAGSLFGGRNPTGRTFMNVTRDHELTAAARRCLATGDEQHHSFEIAGEGRQVSAMVIRLAERPPEALVMLRDITEEYRLQNLRRDFVANVSHELRTPLSTIKVLTETLLDLREEDNEAVEFLRKIDGEVDSMTALVRDLLDLTRLETGSSRLALREIDAGQLVQDVCDRMRPLAARHGVDLNTAIDMEAGTLAGDERRLHQALINLITNAIVHTPASGTVTVGADRGHGTVAFFVRDTGSGISPDNLPRVWERFYKTDRARAEPGTGLGLAIVKHIAQAHSGTVSATSEVGSGSEFRIVIPTDLGPVVRLPAAVDVPMAPN